jgi:creatinine amidohydrolase/Fe(II)-dependent formamide hydrolase-like protein
MAVNESLVKLEHAVREYPAFPVEPTPAMVSAFFFSATGTLPRASQSGVWGDPSGSTAERGREYLDQIEEASVRFVENVESMFRAFPDTTP